MAAAYHHGTETIRIDGGSNPVYTVDGAITAIVGTAPVGAVNELTVCQTKKDFGQFGGELTAQGFIRTGVKRTRHRRAQLSRAKSRQPVESALGI